jgi:hypothetical protein
VRWVERLNAVGDRYSSEIGIDILEKLNKGIPKPKVQPGTMLTPFLDCAIGELYKCEEDFTLHTNKDIINNLQGDSKNFFGAIAELCVGGLLAPFITAHSSPDFMLSINKQTVSIEVTNRISHRGEITSDDDWHKEHRSMIDKINNKKVKQHPDFLFVSFLERASERVSKPMIMNVPIGWQRKVISTPEVSIRGELDNELQGIFCYDFTPLHINSGESIVGTPLAYDFVDILKERFIKMFSIEKAKNVLFALDKIKDRSMSLNYSKDDQKCPN